MLSRALRAIDTLRSFKSFGAKDVYRQMSCQGITRQSAVLYRLLTQTIEAPKKRTVKSDKHIKRKKWKTTIENKKRKRCSSHIMWFKHIMSIAQQLIPIYNTTVHKIKSIFALNMAEHSLLMINSSTCTYSIV